MNRDDDKNKDFEEIEFLKDRGNESKKNEEDISKKIDFEVEKLRRQFESGKTKSYEYRRNFLKRLYEKIKEEEKTIEKALKSDLNKSEFESYMSEIGFVLSEIRFTEKRLKKWMKPKRVFPSLTQMPSSVKEVSEPYGTALVMSPWNYPFQLSISPIIGAIAAGNTVLLKPSEYSRNTSAVLERIFRDDILSESVSIIKGGRTANEEILKREFDYIFFTGSPKVGKVVLNAAADSLTPVTLELGGKSPVIIEKTADIEKTAERICFGKFLNLGQTCIAPDYVLVEESIKDEFLNKMIEKFKEMIPDNEYFRENFPKIINRGHYLRLKEYLKDADIIYGGILFDERRQIYPALINEPSLESDVMTEEIFGPILPVISWKDLNEAINIVESKPKPLALYLFTKDREVENKIIKELSFGGGCVNDTISHIISPRAGFGGVGNSGMGRYHGKYTFETFSHKKTVLKKSWLLDLPVKYHPYTEKALKLVKKIMK